MAFFIFFLQQQRKSLTHTVISVSPLLSLNEDLNKVQVLFDGNAVPRIYQALLRFENTGTTPIEAKDFEVPIDIEVKLTATDFYSLSHELRTKGIVLGATVIERQPENLASQISTLESHAHLSPALLNRGDWLLVQILTPGEIQSVEVSARISGIKELKGKTWQRSSTEFKWYNDLTLTGYIFFSINLGILLVSSYFIKYPNYLVFLFLMFLQFVTISNIVIVILIGISHLMKKIFRFLTKKIFPTS